ncbi:hypothetical protein B5S28_g827 [[Candida] boidinii]|uniref:Unnamed protein product n=1 Tax=Candida boidinii TaxID=5477 RepID=A0ACB5TYP1_CANBO|nr:hypothetical protein B5S28_g827 [[Candida] boidinii]OWB61188.1 hypothetical protein B5S29_g2073 [[Candida] boidinii]OWB71747.1 hypothetical protein B5S31_g1440 [[Candida] boidinii]GME97793.1 unnamed protein product [[Candida] boidinii]
MTRDFQNSRNFEQTFDVTYDNDDQGEQQQQQSSQQQEEQQNELNQIPLPPSQQLKALHYYDSFNSVDTKFSEYSSDYDDNKKLKDSSSYFNSIISPQLTAVNNLEHLHTLAEVETERTITDGHNSNYNYFKQGSAAELSSESETEDDDEKKDDPFDYPEGGWRAYSNLIGSFLGLLGNWGVCSSTGAIQSYIAENQLKTADTTTISWIFSLYLCLMYSATVLSGTYFDRNGVKAPLIIGSLMGVGSLLSIANATEVYQFILGFGILQGLASGILLSPTIGVVSHYFKKNRGLANATATAGGSVGGVMFPLLMKKLFKDIGYVWGMRVLALIVAICYILCFLLIKEREEIKEYNKNKNPIDENASALFNFYKIYVSNTIDFSGLKTDMKFLFVCIGSTLTDCNIFITVTYYSLLLVKAGFTQDDAFILLVILNASSGVGRFFSSYAADKWIGRFNTLIMLLILLPLLYFVFWIPVRYSVKGMYAFTVVFGFFSGSVYSLVPTVIGEVSTTDQFGKRYSTMYFIVGIVLLGMVPASASIIGDGSKDMNIIGFIIFVALCGLFGALAYCVTRYLAIGFRMKKF